METAVKTETRDLAMHPKLLMDTIKRQAGTLQKANLEGVMNALEAGSPVVRIDLVIENGKARLSIHDDGIGIETKEELIAHFETFGTPHDESENTTWKQFRMGRGQMFAFGKNVWRTATFMMVVDIDNKGLTYELTENLPYVKGCQIDIELYRNPIGYSHNSIKQYKECIQKQVRFMEGQILFNNEQINTPASQCKWDFEDKNSYYMFNTGMDFKVYNLGAYVMDAPLSQTGMMGIVVSKKQVKVNFARNDVQHDCPVYYGHMADSNKLDENENPIQKHFDGIYDIVKKNRIKKTRQKRRTLDNWERQATLTELRDGGQPLVKVKTLALIRTAQGKHVSLDFVRKNRQQWCFAPFGSDLADRLMEREQAICFDEAILDAMDYDGPPSLFFTCLTGVGEEYSYQSGYRDNDWKTIERLHVDFKDISSGISDSYSTLPDKKLTTVERRIIKVLNSYHCWKGRVINLGYSERANAWTNGSTYITIDRSFLKRLSVTWARHTNKLMTLLAHEMAHDDDSRGTHIHGPEFYENMCRILRSDDSPTIHNCDFNKRMEKSKIDEKQGKILAQQERAKAKQDKKLGLDKIAASI
jgi:hypothetical protein